MLAGSWLLERHDGRLFFMTVILNDSTKRIDEALVGLLMSIGADLLADEG